MYFNSLHVVWLYRSRPMPQKCANSKNKFAPRSPIGRKSRRMLPAYGLLLFRTSSGNRGPVRNTALPHRCALRHTNARTPTCVGFSREFVLESL